MHKIVKGILVLAGLSFVFSLPSIVSAKIEGNCFECHTQNSNAEEGTVGSLWRTDCVNCHAMGTDQMVVTLPGGIQMPQVFHYDTEGDLAGGNFAYIAEDGDIGPTGSRKGHDVADLFPGDFTFPPGFIHGNSQNYFRKITCAGMNGCHGVRNQMVMDPQGTLVPRVGMSAIQGAHHANVDGPLYVADTVANSFRFLMGVQGLEHTYPPDRWRNVSPVIHNEYYGTTFDSGEYRLCTTCHFGSTQANLTSYITTPRHSMSGFCATCHSNFHEKQRLPVLAFFRHPSDFVLPNKGEYANYQTYEVTAPVARPTVYERPSDIVNPGQDLVMCLSCHVAHASPYDGMLRFDYTRMIAGDAGGAFRKGCFACHTSKGRR
jgi:hypothetical protein